MHRQNMEKLADPRRRKGRARQLLLIAGGTQVTGELAQSWAWMRASAAVPRASTWPSFMVKGAAPRGRSRLART